MSLHRRLAAHAPGPAPAVDAGATARAPGGGEGRPYTRPTMEHPIEAERGSARLDEHYAEAKQLVSYGANQLRAQTERYRELYAATLALWHRQRDELETMNAGAAIGTADEERRIALQRSIDATAAELGRRQLELAKLELVVKQLERTWLFLQRGDSSLVPEPQGTEPPTDLQMRIIEAQEAERQRLAQEIHDGPAQALTNAIFQVEYIERLLDNDPGAARAEIRYLRDLLRRELGDVRTFITQLRPPLLDEIGLYGAIRDLAASLATATGAVVDVQLDAPPEQLGDMGQTVVLRIVQEALQNIRRHAGAQHVRISTHVRPEDGDDWVLEIRDDGRGFDPAQVNAPRGQRSYGLRFMRERAGLIGAQLQVDTRPSGGTHICVTIPDGAERR
jgi:two-component system sensor histidine kinase DegS